MGNDTALAVLAWENEGGYVLGATAGTPSSSGPTTVRVGRIYDPPSAHDRIRVLVDPPLAARHGQISGRDR